MQQSDAGASGTPKCCYEHAVGHSILVSAYHVLDRRQPYAELGGDYFLERQSNQAHVRRLVHQLERLGHKVSIHPAEPAA